MTFSQKVYFLRTKRGFTQKMLSKLTGISQGRISQYEKGETLPRINSLFKLAEGLDVKIEELLDDEMTCKEALKYGNNSNTKRSR